MPTHRAVCPRQWEAARATVVLLLKLWTYFSSHYVFFFSIVFPANSPLSSSPNTQHVMGLDQGREDVFVIRPTFLCIVCVASVVNSAKTPILVTF